MEKVEKKKKRKWLLILLPIVAIIIVVYLVASNVKIHLMDIHPAEIELYCPPLQFFGIEYVYTDHDIDENLPEDVAQIFVPIKDYFRAQDAIKRSHALMGIIDDCLYSFADNLNLGSNS